MRVLIATTSVPFRQTRPDGVAAHLEPAIRALGHDVDRVRIPFTPQCGSVSDQLLALRCLDLSESGGSPVDRLITIGFPAYAIPHPAKTVLLTYYSQMACAPWTERDEGWAQLPESVGIRTQLAQCDKVFMAESRRLFAATQGLAECVRRTVGLRADVAYLPDWSLNPVDDIATEDCFVSSLRGIPVERQQLLIAAMRAARGSYSLRLVMEADGASALAKLRDHVGGLGVGSRIQFVEADPDLDEARLIGGSHGLVYIPEHSPNWEDGLVHALRARKPVITTFDAGAVTEIVKDGENGRVVTPTAEALAAAMDQIAGDARRAAKLGQAAYLTLKRCGISWPQAARTLVS